MAAIVKTCSYPEPIWPFHQGTISLECSTEIIIIGFEILILKLKQLPGYLIDNIFGSIFYQFFLADKNCIHVCVNG